MTEQVRFGKTHRRLKRVEDQLLSAPSRDGTGKAQIIPAAARHFDAGNPLS